MNAQEIFDTVCEHLAQQKRQASLSCGGCEYGMPDGRMCAVGCLLNDQEMTYARNVRGPLMSIISELRPFFASNERLLISLQDAHDDTPKGVRRFRGRLREIAEYHGLEADSVRLITEWNS